jgi:hypothetical protein
VPTSSEVNSVFVAIVSICLKVTLPLCKAWGHTGAV